MAQTPPVRRRRRRERKWFPIELGFVALTVLLTCLVTISGLASLTSLLPREEPENTVLVGAEQTGGAAEGDAQAEDAGTGETGGADSAEPELSDLARYEGAEGYGGQLYALLGEHPEAAYVLRNLSLYPESMLEFVTKYPEAMPYAAAYPDYVNGGLSLPVDLSAEGKSDTVPLLIQWDSRWGFESYGDGLIGWTGCGPTCLSMVALYCNGWDNNDPCTIAQYAGENGYYVNGSGSAWTLMSEASAHFGLTATELTLDENHILRALEAGEPVICAMGEGVFTYAGHFIVITGYVEGQGFTINDPNSPSNSEKVWSFDTFRDQVRNLWSFRAATGE